MKKLLFILAITISFAAKSQCGDPSFTDKIITVVAAAKAYHQAPANQKAQAFNALKQTAQLFYPLTAQQFETKADELLNCPSEMARLTGPIGFAQCVVAAYKDYIHCTLPLNSLGEPVTPNLNACYNAFANSVASCGATHLM